MVVKVATTCLHWTQPSASHPQTLASTSLKRSSLSDGALILKQVNKADRLKHRTNLIRRSCSSSMDFSSAFPDDEFTKQLQELAMRFQTPELETKTPRVSVPDCVGEIKKAEKVFDPLGPPDWPEIGDTLVSASVEWKANSVDIPLSLRMIKRKKQWQEGFRAVGRACSVKKAFSNMVFIVTELQSHSIQMREITEDLQGILSRVHTEMHASFVWLFQQVFSQTPTLMVYVMILLANYSVYSMTSIAAPPPFTETVSILENYETSNKFDSLARDSFVLSDSGKTASIGGGGGGGGDFRPVSSGTGGGGKFQIERTIVPDERKKEFVSEQVAEVDDVRLWDSIVDEATKMQLEFREEDLDQETIQKFVSPVSAKVEEDDYSEYIRTELFYQMGLAQDPSNTLLLANYAQFLYLVAHDYERAEECFKRAVKVEPKDAEALSKYAGFLWQAKKDMWGAEELYLDAISADPANAYYASNYAHFLLSTGGEDTCFPMDA